MAEETLLPPTSPFFSPSVAPGTECPRRVEMASSSAPAARRLLTARVCTTCMRCGAAVAVGDRIVPTESEDARRCLYLHPACAAALAQDKGLEELPMPVRVCAKGRRPAFHHDVHDAV